jgi:DNA-binding NtrC family response regulator
MPATVLIVDDEPAARFALRRVAETECRVVEAGSVPEARRLLEEENPDVILLDHGLPGEDGLTWLRELRTGDTGPAVIMVTAHGSERIAVEAMKLGAYDYLTKPYDVDELRMTLRRALERQSLRGEVQGLRDRLAGEGQFGQMLAVSACMQELFLTAERVARSDLPVLVMGESGTGKDLLAREIHARSLRAKEPFVALNCAALPEHLVESELFGYERGAFTNAVASHPGRFEQANHGTLFLDEIGEMAPGTQAKILRAVESGAVERLGGNRPVKVELRLISATNRDLDAALREGRFREDLYFRLAGVVLYIPPLRKRPEDIPLLAGTIWRELQRKYRQPGPELPAEAVGSLQAAAWPGNVRQLRSVLEKLFVLAPELGVAAADVNHALEPGGRAVVNENDRLFGCDELREARRRFEIEFVTRKLREHGGNVTRTASAIGMARQSLQEKIRELGIEREESNSR